MSVCLLFGFSLEGAKTSGFVWMESGRRMENHRIRCPPHLFVNNPTPFLNFKTAFSRLCKSVQNYIHSIDKFIYKLYFFDHFSPIQKRCGVAFSLVSDRINKNRYEKSIRVYKTFSRRHTYPCGVCDGDD